MTKHARRTHRFLIIGYHVMTSSHRTHLLDALVELARLGQQVALLAHQLTVLLAHALQLGALGPDTVDRVVIVLNELLAASTQPVSRLHVIL